MTKISKSGIVPLQQIKAEHVTRIIDALNGETPNTTIEVKGSVTASYFVGDGSQLTNINIPNQVLKTGEIIISGSNLHINNNEFAWRINQIEFLISPEYDIILPSFTTNYYRYIILQGDNTGNYSIKSGIESLNIGIPPSIDSNNILLSTLLFFGNSLVGQPEYPNIGNSYVEKIESDDFIVDYGNTTILNQIDFIDNRSSLTLTNSITDIKSLQIPNNYIRPGKPLIIKNKTNHNVTIWNNAGTGNIKFSIPDSLNYIIYPNEILEFILNTTTSNYKFELIGNSISTLITAKEYIDSKVVGLYKFKGSVANFASLPSSGQINGDVWNTNDTDMNYAWTGTVWDPLGTTFDISTKLDKAGYSGTAATLKTDIDNIYQPDVLISSITPTRSVNTFTYPALGYDALINKVRYKNATAFVTTIGVATDLYKRTDLIYMTTGGVIGKKIGNESLTVAVRPDLAVGEVGISFINIFGATVESPTPIDKKISVQNSFGIEQFKIDDFVRFRGSSFNSVTKEIIIDPLVPFTAFVNNVSGSDITGEFGNSNKPYKTIDAVFNGITDSVNRLIIVQLVNVGTYPILNKLPTGQITIRSAINVTLDLTNNLNQYLFTYSDGNLVGCSFSFDIPFGTIYNGKFTGGVSIAQGQTNFFLNVKSINWLSSSFIFYGTNVFFQGIQNIVTKGRLSIQGINSGFKVSSFTIPSDAINAVFQDCLGVMELGSVVIDSTKLQFSSNCYFKIGNITGIGIISFAYHTGNTTIEFLNSNLSVPVKFNQGVETVTFTGVVNNMTIDTTTPIGNNNGNIFLTNLVIKNLIGYFETYRKTNFYLDNCSITVNGKLFSFIDVGGVNADSKIRILNSIIKQTVPTYIIYNTTNIVNLEIGGLETNALSFGNNSKVVSTYSLLSFKDKKNEIIVRSKVDIINKILDPLTTYIIDGNLTLLSGENIIVPVGGMTIAGYGFNVSGITKNISGQSIFISQSGGSGDFITKDIVYNSGLGKVFDLIDVDGSHAIEMNDVNFQSCSSIGILNGYRQFTGTTCGFYSCLDGLTLDGNWSGFKMTNSNIIGFGGSGTLFKKGATMLFSNRFYIDLNLSFSLGAKLSDFSSSNFSANELFQINNTLLKINGVTNVSNTVLAIPNITANDPKSKWTNSLGITLTAQSFQDLKSATKVWRLSIDDLGVATYTDIT